MKKEIQYKVTASYYDSRTNEELTEKEFLKRAREKQLRGKNSPRSDKQAG